MIFIDTDAELSERAPSRLGMSIADRIVVMLSPDWRAYVRLKADSRNSLFRFLESRIRDGEPVAKIDMLLTNGVEKKEKDPMEIEWPADIPSPGGVSPGPKLKVAFTPTKAAQRELTLIAADLYAYADQDQITRQMFFNRANAERGTVQQFYDYYVRAPHSAFAQLHLALCSRLALPTAAMRRTSYLPVPRHPRGTTPLTNAIISPLFVQCRQLFMYAPNIGMVTTCTGIPIVCLEPKSYDIAPAAAIYGAQQQVRVVANHSRHLQHRTQSPGSPPASPAHATA